jgi:hypothetical protein
VSQELHLGHGKGSECVEFGVAAAEEECPAFIFFFYVSLFHKICFFFGGGKSWCGLEVGDRLCLYIGVNLAVSRLRH